MTRDPSSNVRFDIGVNWSPELEALWRRVAETLGELALEAAAHRARRVAFEYGVAPTDEPSEFIGVEGYAEDAVEQVLRDELLRMLRPQ